MSPTSPDLQKRILTRDFDLFLGIDPGVHTGIALYNKASGFHEVNKRKKLLTCETVLIHQAIDRVRSLSSFHGERLLVRIEDARLRKWIPNKKDEKGERGRNQGAGSIKRDCGIWEDFLTEYMIPFEMIAPAAGRSKWKADYFKTITGWNGRTDEHSRDAAALVFGL